jgi:ATP/maltotriose-dependent transcriptional regulator MalT
VAALVRAKALYAATNLTWIVEEDNDRAEALAGESLALYRELGDRQGIATSLRMLGAIASYRSQYTVARSQLEEAEALFREAGEAWGRGKCLTLLAQIATVQGEYAWARVLLEESRGLFSALGDQYQVGWVLILQAQMLFLSGGHPFEAQALAEQGLGLVREIGDDWMTVYALSILGRIRLQQGEQALARELFEACLATYQEQGDSDGIAQMQIDLARILAVQGEVAGARALYQKSLVLLREKGNEEFIPACLEGLADIAAAQGEPVWAAQLWGAAEALREALGTPLPPVARADYEGAVAGARTTSGVRAFAVACAQGRSMTPEQALAAPEPVTPPEQAPTTAQLPPSARKPLTYPAGLTAREVEILRLVAQGRTDAQVAEQLVISPRTVNWHLTSIYSKLQVSSRSAATRYAIEQKLV